VLADYPRLLGSSEEYHEVVLRRDKKPPPLQAGDRATGVGSALSIENNRLFGSDFFSSLTFFVNGERRPFEFDTIHVVPIQFPNDSGRLAWASFIVSLKEPVSRLIAPCEE
jgi:hypothetical protein